jgi:hypothetical protein
MERPKSRLVTRRHALSDIANGLNEVDYLLFKLDQDFKEDKLSSIKSKLDSKNYESAIDEIITSSLKRRPSDEKELYSLVLDKLDKDITL